MLQQSPRAASFMSNGVNSSHSGAVDVVVMKEK